MRTAPGADMDLTSLARRGFVVVRDFLDGETIAGLREDFATRGPPRNRNYPIRIASGDAVERVRPVLEAMAARVREQTGICVDRITGGAYFSMSLGFDSQWHQDHESYFLMQEHYHHLNFWIPIDKPDRARSNVSVVPLDVIAQRRPGVARRLFGAGGIRSQRLASGTELIFDESGEHVVLGFPLEELAETPALGAGDLLLMRGDVLHQTQDTATQRTAVSFHMLQAATPIRRERLLSGSLSKRVVLLRNPWDYTRALRLMNASPRRCITAGELLDSFVRGDRDPLGTLRALAQLVLPWRPTS